MTFTPDMPITGDTLGSTRDRIRGNFQETAAVFAINHVAFNNTGKGKHPFLQMPEQSAAPTTLVNEGGFYCKQATNPAETNMFFRGESNGKEYQITSADQTNNANFGTFPGWSFLPGGLVIQYGSQNSIGNSITVVFPKAFKATTVPIVTFVATDQGWQLNGTPINTQFQAISVGTSATINWIAIGQS
jgi:hypothetical protein